MLTFHLVYDPKRTIELGGLVRTTVSEHSRGSSFQNPIPHIFRLDLQDYDLIISSSSSFC